MSWWLVLLVTTRYSVFLVFDILFLYLNFIIYEKNGSTPRHKALYILSSPNSSTSTGYNFLYSGGSRRDSLSKRLEQKRMYQTVIIKNTIN